jgi:Mrp family chromosome partitioning ATPase
MTSQGQEARALERVDAGASGCRDGLVSGGRGGWRVQRLGVVILGRPGAWISRFISGLALNRPDVTTDHETWKGITPMRRIAFVNLKGGVGKSTCAATIAVGLAKRGRRVLLIDADAQGHAAWTATRGQGVDDPGLGDVLMRRASAVDAIRPTPTDGLDVLPAGSSLGGANIALAPFWRTSRDMMRS